jgi:hypothetical protein
MNEAKYLNGLIAKPPHEKAPDFVKCKLSIKRAELMQSLHDMDGEWINLVVKESKGGKWYAQIDEWKPNRSQNGNERSQVEPAKAEPRFDDETIPF